MAASSGRAPARGHAVRRGPAARTLSADVADVADERAVAALFDTAESTFGGIDVVVHTPGRNGGAYVNAAGRVSRTARSVAGQVLTLTKLQQSEDDGEVAAETDGRRGADRLRKAP
ncbi:hypothetical protein [Microtetraspora glauca]|uniref:SDR family NAD(P)-dependent oxidoreductase n=1 Tax=Microtetraspora glauca TaxID=1996 RepID=A0ABV3GBW0_MICGL